MNETYWKKFYAKKDLTGDPSTFAESVFEWLHGKVIELGCGNKRDLRFFERMKPSIQIMGIDQAEGVDVEDYMRQGECTFDCVYTRFFWHSIRRQTQLRILKWTKSFIFIEARTTDDALLPKTFSAHDRNYVKVSQLVCDLKEAGFEILLLNEGQGFAPFKDEDPHIVRIIARKVH